MDPGRADLVGEAPLMEALGHEMPRVLEMKKSSELMSSEFKGVSENLAQKDFFMGAMTSGFRHRRYKNQQNRGQFAYKPLWGYSLTITGIDPDDPPFGSLW